MPAGGCGYVQVRQVRQAGRGQVKRTMKSMKGGKVFRGAIAELMCPMPRNINPMPRRALPASAPVGVRHTTGTRKRPAAARGREYWVRLKATRWGVRVDPTQMPRQKPRLWDRVMYPASRRSTTRTLVAVALLRAAVARVPVATALHLAAQATWIAFCREDPRAFCKWVLRVFIPNKKTARAPKRFMASMTQFMLGGVASCAAIFRSLPSSNSRPRAPRRAASASGRDAKRHTLDQCAGSRLYLSICSDAFVPSAGKLRHGRTHGCSPGSRP